ncbi:MAG: serine hydrolase, partial [Cyclobacteriaceae bacterium]|nr:serine hydrolase [Cyclobacteriaceae bacterium]
MRYIFLFLVVGFFYNSFGQDLNFSTIEKEKNWVDSVFSKLSDKEKISQLIIIRALTPDDEPGKMKVLNELKELKPGGVTFFAGDPLSQLDITNRMQAEARVPMLVSIDGEWGLAMRLSNTIAYPYQMALGAIQDDALIYEMGAEIARQCKRMGIHINFAPVVDINNNPANPVINYRSFGEDKWNVARKGLAYAKGLEDNGVLSSIKHFPGHGDTGTDSHLALPVLPHSRERMDSLELFPFKYIIENNIGGIMVGHLNIPALDSDTDRASSLSKKIVTGELRNKMGFGGVIMTDALEMKGVASHYSAGKAAVESFKAGNDVLVLPESLSEALAAIEAEIKKGGIKRSEIDEKCKKLLRLKYRLGLNQKQYFEKEGLLEDLNSPSAHLLNRKLIENALTVVQNNDAIPVKDLNQLKVASLSVGAEGITEFQNGLSRYTQVSHFQIGVKGEKLEDVQDELKEFDLV